MLLHICCLSLQPSSDCRTLVKFSSYFVLHCVHHQLLSLLPSFLDSPTGLPQWLDSPRLCTSPSVVGQCLTLFNAIQKTLVQGCFTAFTIWMGAHHLIWSFVWSGKFISWSSSEGRHVYKDSISRSKLNFLPSCHAELHVSTLCLMVNYILSLLLHLMKIKHKK